MRGSRTLTSNRLIGLMLLLALGGIGVSAYLMWGYTTPGATLACGGSHGCEAVKNSEYANLLGIPLPLFGLISFLVILSLLIIQNQRFINKDHIPAYVALMIFAVTLGGGLYSVYLTYLELFVIYAICRWCIASAVIMSMLLVLSVINLRNQNQAY